jgi:aminoglycoside phosphotransferase (APT) family kinase protein
VRADDRPSTLDTGVQSQIASTLGSAIRAAIPAAWGFKNETWDVLLSDDRGIIVQIFRDREDATHRVNTMRSLQHLTDLPIPRVIAVSLDTARMWAAYARLEGESGYQHAGSELADEAWPSMAEGMGSVVRSLQLVPIARLDLPDLWARPEALAEAAYRWAAEIESFYSSTTKRAVTRLIDAAANTLGSFIPVVCHGDFGPQNVLFSGTTVTGLLDLEDVRLGHPLLDVGWWNWLVRAHTPSAFGRSWDRFLDGAGIDRTQDGFDERIHTLIVLRLLETAATFRRTQPEKHASWGARIEKEIIAPAPSR